MNSLTLGPNGGLLFCIEFLEKNMNWLLQQLSNYKGHYFLFDCPGQVIISLSGSFWYSVLIHIVKLQSKPL